MASCHGSRGGLLQVSTHKKVFKVAKNSRMVANGGHLATPANTNGMWCVNTGKQLASGSKRFSHAFLRVTLILSSLFCLVHAGF